MSAYVEDSLSPGLTDRISDHLERCRRCRDQESGHRQAMRLLDHGRHTPSIDLWADFSRRLQQQQPPPRRPAWPYLWQPGLATAMAAIIVALVARSAPMPSLGFETPAPPTAIQAATPPVATDPAEPMRGRVDAPKSKAAETSPRAAQVAAAQNSGFSQAERVESRRRRASRRTIRLARATPAPEPTVPRRKPASEPVEGEQTTAMVRIARADPSLAGPDIGSSLLQPAADTPVPSEADPLEVAEALVEAQQKAMCDRVQTQLQQMALEVARVGGEMSDSEDAAQAAGT
jgi:hypothetical protein